MSLHRLPNGTNKPGSEHVVMPPHVASWLAFIGVAVLIMAAFMAHPALGWCAVGFVLLCVAGGMKGNGA